MGSQKTDIKQQLEETREFVNSLLKRYLRPRKEVDPRLQEAMEYAVHSPGKRLRGVLVLWACELFATAENRKVEAPAAAIELVHAYSLVHDDLPAMDNDDMRRGRPTCHKRFDEATAILAGDGLLTLAFEILGKDVSKAEIAVRLVAELAEAAGVSGMVSGQMADLRAENTPPDKKLLEYIHRNKTAKMFAAAAAMGAICGDANGQQIETLKEYGMKLGLSFQIADDILDVSASSEQLGKTAGKDAEQGKTTYPSVVGMEQSKKLLEKFSDQAVALLGDFGDEADKLRQLAVLLVERSK